MLVVTLAQLQSYVGAPPTRTQTFRRTNGELVEWGWRDALGGTPGWWFGVTSGERVLSIGWTGGDERDRDYEIRRAIRLHMRPAVPQVIA